MIRGLLPKQPYRLYKIPAGLQAKQYLHLELEQIPRNNRTNTLFYHPGRYILVTRFALYFLTLKKFKMKDNEAKKSTGTNKENDQKHPSEIEFHLPPGVKFGDIYMDAPQLAQELNFGKRTISNMRNSGKLSCTTLFGKLFYFRQEIAAILEANRRDRK